MLLKDKHILVTGANGALGQAVVAKARTLGARLVLVDMAVPTGEEGDLCLAVDLTDREQVEACFSRIGPIDAVLHLVGGFDMGEQVIDGASSCWEAMFRINVLTFQNVVSQAVPPMLDRRRGAIVSVGALSALKGLPGMGAYCAAKSALMRLTESLSAEVKAKGINVNAVLPSIIDTPRNRMDMPDADSSAWVAPEDLANVICFLASDHARAIHGAMVPVAGLTG